jgi:hypothetical protein
MSLNSTNLRELIATLPAPVTPLSPPPQLWSRIAQAHRTRLRRRRIWRWASATSLATGLIALAGLIAWPARNNPPPAHVDWQARAQALELQLDTLPMPVYSQPTARETETALTLLDRRLQAAYDRGGAAEEIGPLWQRRSELLDALLTARRQQFRSTRT